MITDEMVNRADSVLSKVRGGIPDEVIRSAIEAALSAAEPVPVAYRHTLHMELGQTDVEVNTSEKHPFGRPNVDYSPEYRVTTEPLYAAPLAPSVAVKAILAELDNVLVNDEQDRETLAKIRTMVSALSAQEQGVAGWQSMDTAPKDGSEFAAGRRYSPDGDFVVHTYRWVGPPNYWLSKRNGVCIRPSYQDDYKWCPIPAAPAKQEVDTTPAA